MGKIYKIITTPIGIYPAFAVCPIHPKNTVWLRVQNAASSWYCIECRNARNREIHRQSASEIERAGGKFRYSGGIKLKTVAIAKSLIEEVIKSGLTADDFAINQAKRGRRSVRSKAALSGATKSPNLPVTQAEQVSEASLEIEQAELAIAKSRELAYYIGIADRLRRAGLEIGESMLSQRGFPRRLIRQICRELEREAVQD